ncbi:MAG: CinA family nicotinamide mononucleotide deamidase-related protein [Dehalococcoidales bacterium]|nr:CinA family nicotinamide mononucleotide deamidase-related protein [Dehalococcoidales bacterium]
MKAEIISTGTEILLGNIVDTNTAYLAEQLAALGIDLYYTCTVGDNYERLLGALKAAAGRSDLILMTGGLGPTQGDITRDVIAGLFEEKMEVDLALKTTLEQFFSSRSIAMSSNNLKQAMLIPSAQAIPNARGTAPGWWAEKNNKIVIAMPGPPGEMQMMWQNHVLPALKGRTDGSVILSRTLKTYGMPEGSVDEQLSPLLKSTNPTIAMYAKADGIHLRITAKADTKEEAEKLIAPQEQAIRDAINKYIWGVDDDDLAVMVGKMLTDRGMTLAVVETFSNGTLIQVLARTPNSGNFFKGGYYAASEEVKTSLGLEWGSGDMAKTAGAVASLVREKVHATIGIDVEGYLEKSGEAPMAKIIIAIAGAKSKITLTRSFPGRLTFLEQRIAYQVLFELKNFLAES